MSYHTYDIVTKYVHFCFGTSQIIKSGNKDITLLRHFSTMNYIICTLADASMCIIYLAHILFEHTPFKRKGLGVA